MILHFYDFLFPRDLVEFSLMDDTKEGDPSLDQDKDKETASSTNQETELDRYIFLS